MHQEATARRTYGSGSLFIHRGAWYGQWRAGGRQVKRKIGPKRQPAQRDGLTRPQAERELRRRVEAEATVIATGERRTVEQAGDRLMAHLEALGRKPSTLATYRSLMSAHLVPHLGAWPLDRVTPSEVERLMAAMRTNGAGAKLTRNAITLLHQVFAFGQRRGWCAANPCERVDRPVVEQTTDIRFLDLEEVEALLAAVPQDDPLGPTDRALYLTAAMTGLRQGELLGLRWVDVDWLAGRIRVRRNYVRGHWGTPKSRRGSRSVPLADRVAGELDRHFKGSVYQADDDLVFCHPDTGRVLDHSDLVRRFKRARDGAGVTPITFHGLRHSFATAMAGAGVPLRLLQEWLGHRDFKTVLIYADYCPSEHEAEFVQRAFAGTNSGTNLASTETKSEQDTTPTQATEQPETTA